MDNFLTENATNILIENLTHYLKKNDFNSYTYIKNSLNQLVIPFPAISIKIDKFLYRARRHENPECFYNAISDISHREDIFNITEFGRANEPCQSIFYCSDLHEIAIAETTPIIRNDLKLDSDVLTIGIWKVKKELRLASLLNHPLICEQNPTQKLLDSRAKELIESFQNEHTGQLLKLHKFITEEFTKPSSNNPAIYLLSCAFANYIYENSGYDTALDSISTVDGIIYPSSICPNFGMNLALKPSVLDEDKIVLVGARKTKLIKQDETYYNEDETFDSISINVDKNEISWNKFGL